jgi:zinc transporter ZupT
MPPFSTRRLVWHGLRLLPFSFAFAAGAMLALIAVELLPKAYAGQGLLGPSGGVVPCGAVMLGLSFVLGV